MFAFDHALPTVHLYHPFLRKLHMNGLGLDSVTLKEVLGLLVDKCASRLVYLDISDTALDTLHSRGVATRLGGLKALLTLKANNVGFYDSGASALFGQLPPLLQHLAVENACLTVKSVAVLCVSAKQHKALQTLNLSRNQLHDAGAVCLMSALRLNAMPALKSLVLGNNALQFDPTVWVALPSEAGAGAIPRRSAPLDRLVLGGHRILDPGLGAATLEAYIASGALPPVVILDLSDSNYGVAAASCAPTAQGLQLENSRLAGGWGSTFLAAATAQQRSLSSASSPSASPPVCSCIPSEAAPTAASASASAPGADGRLPSGLTWLSLRKNGLTSRSALPDLTQLLTVNKTLTWLDLRDNGFTSGLDALLVAVADSPLRTLRLEGNHMDLNQAQAILHAVRNRNTSLTTLTLAPPAGIVGEARRHVKQKVRDKADRENKGGPSWDEVLRRNAEDAKITMDAEAERQGWVQVAARTRELVRRNRRYHIRLHGTRGYLRTLDGVFAKLPCDTTLMIEEYLVLHTWHAFGVPL